MEKESIKTLIRLGFEPARYFKRSAWVKVERVMEYLANIGEVRRNYGEVKYATNNGGYSEDDLNRWSDLFIKSPVAKHIDAMKAMSKELSLPLNSRELLNRYMDLKTK